jgi:hypothetical protein
MLPADAEPWSDSADSKRRSPSARSVVTDELSVVTVPASVVTDELSVVTDATSVVTDKSSVVTDKLSVVTDKSSVATDTGWWIRTRHCRSRHAAVILACRS